MAHTINNDANLNSEHAGTNGPEPIEVSEYQRRKDVLEQAVRVYVEAAAQYRLFVEEDMLGTNAWPKPEFYNGLYDVDTSTSRVVFEAGRGALIFLHNRMVAARNVMILFTEGKPIDTGMLHATARNDEVKAIEGYNFTRD